MTFCEAFIRAGRPLTSLEFDQRIFAAKAGKTAAAH
jgi:hypothetical protein